MRGILKLVVVLTLIAAGSALILSLVESVTREPIAEQRRQETLRALKAVLPAIDNDPAAETVTLSIGKDRKGKDIFRTFYLGRKEGALTSSAFSVTATEGYGGNIVVMVGVDTDGKVTGIEILSHMETPGLGDKITQAWFKEQFKGKSLESADWRVKKDGGEFDQITGATISPRAVVSAVRDGLDFYKTHSKEILQGTGVSQ